MTELIVQLRQAVQAVLDTERQNFLLGLHRRHDVPASVWHSRDRQFGEVLRRIDAAGQAAAGASAREGLQLALGNLYRACYKLKVWDRACDRREPGVFDFTRPPGWVIPVNPDAEAEGLLSLIVDRVNDALAQVDRTAYESQAPQGFEHNPARHGLDFRSVYWFGAEYGFTGTQAACIKVLWQAWANKTPDVRQQALLDAADADTERLDHLFRDHPAWKAMIVPGTTKGTYRLAPPTSA
jgi:hypothetical protein